MKTNRREFLGAAAGAAVLGSLARADEAREKLRLGLIGAGWYGMVDAEAALKAGGVEVTAVCDVDEEHLAKSADKLEQLQGSRPKTLKYYEELLDQEGLDAVIIATPPQWHALQFLAALERGLDIYCEKPLAYDVREGQAMLAAARKSPDRIVEIGFQRRQSRAFREVREFVAAGKAGRIVQADVQIHYRAGTKDPTPKDPPPGLDWDLWCGPAPKIAYSEQVGHLNWRLEKTTGHGHLVDWGIHNIDATRLMLGLAMPRRITADGGLYKYQGIITTPDTLTVHFEFEQLPVVWRHRLWGAQEYTPETNNGVFLYGEEATIFATDQQWTVIPVGKPDQRELHEAKADLGTLHMADFLDAVRQRRAPACPIDDAFRSTATVQLGAIAYETHSVVHWDETGAAIADNPAAAALLKREYRAPYKHPWQG